MRSAETMLDSYRTLLLEKGPNGQIADAAGPLTFGPRLVSSQAPDAYKTITYGKGIWVMQMLRRRMGDERFLAMLRELTKRYDHREITTDDFRQAAADSSRPGPTIPSWRRSSTNGLTAPASRV